MDDGAVPKETVVLVLKSCGVSVSERLEGEKSRTTLIRGEVVEVQYFPDLVPRRLVLRLAHKFQIPRHLFWHPEMMAPDQRLPGLMPS